MIRICSILGDGIGQEVIPSAERVLTRFIPEVSIERAQAGFTVFQELGTALPEDTLGKARAADAVLFGAVGSPLHPVQGYRSPIVQLRRDLNLYANLRPTRGAKANLLIVRENTEGLYAGRESLVEGGEMAIAERVITKAASRRIVRRAFEEALSRGWNRVTLVHKANVLRVTDGLFRGCAMEVAAEFPRISMDELLVDTAAMRLAEDPSGFQVIVTTNLFGDILSDVACIHGGGIAEAASANVGDSRGLFEPVHGSAPDIAGKGIASPLAAFECLVLMLQWLAGQKSAPALAAAADRLSAVLAEVRALGCRTTIDWEDRVLERLTG